jgi:hypothetical protein
MVNQLLQARSAEPAHEPGVLATDFWMAA